MILKTNIISYYKTIVLRIIVMPSSFYSLRNNKTTGVQKTAGKLVSLLVESPKQNEVPTSPSMPELIPASSFVGMSSHPLFDDVCEPRNIFYKSNKDHYAKTNTEVSKEADSASAHNDEQTMLWQNVATLYVKCEDNASNITGIRAEYDPCIGQLNSYTDDLYAKLQTATSEIADMKKNTKKKFKSARKMMNRKLDKCKRGSSMAASDADMEVFKYIDTLRIQIDELRGTVEKQKDEIDELSSGLKHHMDKMREEVSDLNDLYDDDFHRFCKREDELKDGIAAAHDEAMLAHTFAIKSKQNSDSRIDAAVQAIETWGADIYRMDEEVKNMNREIRDDMEIERQSSEYWVERALKTFEDEKLAHFQSQIASARSYADTMVAGDLREEFSAAIVREITFESKVSAELVQGVHNELSAVTQGLRTELVDLITRSNEIHSARYFQSVDDAQQVKEDMDSFVQTLKHSIELVDLELEDVKESVGFSKEYMTDLSIEIEDQKDLIIHEIHSEMDRDYRDLKKYIRRKLNQHLSEEHPEDEDEEEDEEEADEEEADKNVADEDEVKAESAVTSVSTAEETDVSTAEETDVMREEANNEDTVIIMSDADFNSTDDEQ